MSDEQFSEDNVVCKTEMNEISEQQLVGNGDEMGVTNGDAVAADATAENEDNGNEVVSKPQAAEVNNSS